MNIETGQDMAQRIEKAWDVLVADWVRLQGVHLRDMFADDPGRFDRFSADLGDLTMDFSKERIDTDALKHLFDLAQAADVEARRDAMFAGEHINITEDRAVMHMALRGTPEDDYRVDGQKTADLVAPVQEAFLKFADEVRASGTFTDVVNIGIGGSDLGPVMTVRALSDFGHAGPNVHFVSNIDGAHLSDTLQGLNPETTLFIVASKTFTTQETMTNAQSAKQWVEATLGAGAARAHFAAVSTNLKGTEAFGIAPERVFGFWDWVGGRYSVTSSIGLSLAMAIGGNNFRAMLDGFRSMDQHFKTAPLAQNLPVLLALIGIWRRNIMGCTTVGLIPYSQRLERFAAYVQQMDMESNGKRVTRNGRDVAGKTGPVIWGGAGTNVQHSFFQLIHQGTDIIPIDFMINAQPTSDLVAQHDILTANFLAQSHALAFGKTADEVRKDMQDAGASPEQIEALVPHRTFLGNRPSTSLLDRSLTPFSLGRLIALYEHKVFVQGVIWDVNSFDQWGVELGKVMARKIEPLLTEGADLSDLNSSTRGLIQKMHYLKQD